jgi:hypothetical protein
MAAPGTNPVSWVGDPTASSQDRRRFDVHATDPNVRKLYGPKGEVLRTFSDRPPVGFHQGERGR